MVYKKKKPRKRRATKIIYKTKIVYLTKKHKSSYDHIKLTPLEKQAKKLGLNPEDIIMGLHKAPYYKGKKRR